MKQVVVSTPFSARVGYMMIEDMDDVETYRAILESGVEDTITRLIHSSVDPDRWDHMIHRDDIGGVMSGAIMSANIKGTNPIYEAGPLVVSKLNSITEIVQSGECVLVNENGGYCPFNEDGYHTIVESAEWVANEEVNYVINDNTKYINLENDPDLEQHTIDYLSSVDSNYSYITKLRKHDANELVEIFNQFQKAGGKVVYVYTTGLDVPQMKEYASAIIHSGLKRVEFEFNAGYNDDHRDVVQYLVDAGVTVSVIGS